MADQHDPENEPTRRDFLYIATGAATAMAVGGVVFPLVFSLGPNAQEQAAGQPLAVDVSAIKRRRADHRHLARQALFHPSPDRRRYCSAR